MAHVFISYARTDEPLATLIADSLREDGFEVWRDDELPAHRAYADVIEERIKGAGAVVVLWSAEATKSQWVRAEADVARAALTLVQATLDGTVPPMPFNQIQCADLKQWDGQRSAGGWRKLIASVTELAGAPAAEPSSRTISRDVSVCVLPFQNMSGDPEQEYFSDGISEDITTDLSKVSALEVIARNTAFTFKGQSVNVCEVAKKLGVTHVLEGSVRKVGNQVRITAQLIEGQSGGHAWADRYDRDLSDIFAIQDEISKAIVAALKLKLLPEEKKAIEKRGTQSAEAYNLYLLARQYWVTGNHGDMRREERVMRICGRAVEIDPNYAQAWALLAIAQSSLRYGFGQEVDDGYVAAHTALAIDPSIAEAHLPMLRRFQERGEIEAAGREMEAAIRLGPESWEVNKDAGQFYLNKQDVPTATRHYEKAAELMESDFHAWAMLSTCYQASGDTAKLRQVGEANDLRIATRRAAGSDERGRARHSGRRLRPPRREGKDPRMDRPRASGRSRQSQHALQLRLRPLIMRDTDAALKMLQSALAVSGRGAFQIRVAETDTDFDNIRDDPRFSEVIAEAKKCAALAKPAAAI